MKFVVLCSKLSDKKRHIPFHHHHHHLSEFTPIPFKDTMRIHLAQAHENDKTDVETIFPEEEITCYEIIANQHQSIGAVETKLNSQWKLDELKKKIQFISDDDLLIAIDHGLVENQKGQWMKIPFVSMMRKGRYMHSQGEGIPVDITKESFFPDMKI